MSYWNLEASEDGFNWYVLHEARDDQHLYPPTDATTTLLKEHIIDYLLSYAERNFRHTWTINPEPTAFCRCFQLIGLGADIPEENMTRDGMHGVGLAHHMAC
jgi:hypothetical protein